MCESITSVGTRKVEHKFSLRNVTELIVDDGQQADRGRQTRLNDVDGLVRCMKSAGRVRNKSSFGELWNQKGKCLIPCDKQLCSFPTLSEQESSQTRQMDRGEIEVEEERRVRTKRMPVLPTERERNMKTRTRTWRSAASARQKIPASMWRTSRRCDRGFLAHSTDADLVANTTLIQKLHSVAEARQVSHEAPESHAVNCVLENLEANGLGRVLLKGDVGSAAQTLVDPVWVGRGERTMAGRSQVVRVRMTCERSIVRRRPMIHSVLPERFGCRAKSKGIVPPWLLQDCMARVLQSIREA